MSELKGEWVESALDLASLLQTKCQTWIPQLAVTASAKALKLDISWRYAFIFFHNVATNQVRVKSEWIQEVKFAPVQ